MHVSLIVFFPHFLLLIFRLRAQHILRFLIRNPYFLFSAPFNLTTSPPFLTYLTPPHSSHVIACRLTNYRALRLTRQSHEKDHAFAGLIALINANPSVLYSPSSVTVPNAFFVACSSWEDPPDEPLLSQLSRILRTYKVRH